jgi:hypothetical protein
MIRLQDFIDRYMTNINQGDNSTTMNNAKLDRKKLKQNKRKKKKRFLPKPANIHRPYRDICRSARAHFPTSLYYVVHYIGTWEQYSIQRPSDLRRKDVKKFEKKAYIDNGNICGVNDELHDWIYHFRQRLQLNMINHYHTNQSSFHVHDNNQNDDEEPSLQLAKYLLGSNESI